MRKVLAAAVLAAMGTAAPAQTPTWQYYEEPGTPLQAFVVSSDGLQLILKCDKPGKGKVMAFLVTKSPIAPPLTDGRYESREVRVRVDQQAPYDDNWRFNDRFAMAVNQHSQRSLSRLLEKMADGQAVEVMLKPFKQAPIQTTFAIAGTREAAAKVYEACKDQNPLG